MITGCTTKTEKVIDTNVKIEEQTEEKKYKIVCASVWQKDWIEEILGEHSDKFQVTLLQKEGVDLHNYQPNTQDVIEINEADLFVYTGGESEEWVNEILTVSSKNKVKAMNLMEELGEKVKAEEIVEGMQEAHDHLHSHTHTRHKEVSYFNDDEVKDRGLDNWQGEWQSAYPLLMKGELDRVFEFKEQEGDKSKEEYKKYYETGYRTEYKEIIINDNMISFVDMDGNISSSEYKYVGYVLQDWSSGTRAALYRFEAKNKESGVPVYIELNDHIIEPVESGHFHIRMSSDSFDEIKNLETSWPTFYPKELTSEQICDEIIGHDHSEEDGEKHQEEHVHKDEHIWLSLKNAVILIEKLAEEIKKLDESHKGIYEANMQEYKKQLMELDEKYSQRLKEKEDKTVVFADRFPFRYLLDDYSVNYCAAFSGCSTETEAEFDTIMFLSEKVKDKSGIVVLEQSDQKLANTIIKNSGKKGIEILEMDSMQIITKKRLEEGRKYLEIMENNLKILEKALN